MSSGEKKESYMIIRKDEGKAGSRYTGKLKKVKFSLEKSVLMFGSPPIIWCRENALCTRRNWSM